MQYVLYCKDLHDPIKGDSAKPSDMSNRDWEKLNRKTIRCIRQCIDVSVFHHVSQETNAEVRWEKLRSLYERKTTQNKAFITRRLVNLKLKKGKSIAEHLSEFQDLVNQMVTMNLVIDDELQALLLLSSLLDNKVLDSNRSLNHKRERFKVFEAEPRSNWGRNVMII